MIYKVPENKIIQSGLLGGLIGAALMISLSIFDLTLGFFMGYLYLLIIVVAIYCSSKFYKKSEYESTFLKRVLVGLLTYFVIVICFTTWQISTERFPLHNNISEYLLVVALHVSIAFALSFLFLFGCKESLQEKATTLNKSIANSGAGRWSNLQ